MDTRPVKIYAEKDVPRLRYIASLILGDILGLTWEVTTDKRKLGKHPVINYSGDSIAGSFKIEPYSLLFENGVSAREIEIAEWKTIPVFFSSGSDSDLPFDIFAASFYLVTRYEEYLEHSPDEYGRFKASGSLAFRHGFLGLPVIDLWAREMAKAMLKKLPMLTYRRHEFRSFVTVDSDEPFLNSDRGILSTITGLFHERKKYIPGPEEYGQLNSGTEKDPFDVFGYISDKLTESATDALFFFPVGDRSVFDKNPSWKNINYRKLIKFISNKYKTGLHPSYKAAYKPALYLTEQDRLSHITEKQPLLNRFHFSRIFFPFSYRMLLDAGITEDYSMGYPEEPGFRAGISRPFMFYDVIKDTHTNLKVVPFQFMDQTLFKHMELDCVKSKEIIQRLISETRKVGGLFVSVWHNTSLIENEECAGRRELFELLVKRKLQ